MDVRRTAHLLQVTALTDAFTGKTFVLLTFFLIYVSALNTFHYMQTPFPVQIKGLILENKSVLIALLVQLCFPFLSPPSVNITSLFALL